MHKTARDWILLPKQGYILYSNEKVSAGYGCTYPNDCKDCEECSTCREKQTLTFLFCTIKHSLLIS